MNELIPPIGPRSPAAGVETDRKRGPVGAKANTADTVSTLLPDARKTTDALSVHFNRNGDAESLKAFMTVIMDRVVDQMMRVFPDDPELREKLGLPEDIEEYSMERLNDYFGPRQTAQRIIDFTTGFLGAYKLNHEGEQAAEQIRDFTSLISEGIQKGFEEAIGILGDLDELGEIGENIKKTYDLVMEGLDEFRKEQLNLLGELEHAPLTAEQPAEELTPEAPSPMQEGLPTDEEQGDLLDLTV